MKISQFFALAFLLSASITSFASAPQVKTQAPGYYRTMVGDIEVTTLLDGFFPLKPKELLSKVNDKTNALVTKSYQGDTILTSVNGFLINTGSRLILIDTGCGTFYGPGMGHVMANLKAAGYTPEQVDEIEITHMHTDHLGGIFLDGKAAYPNAILRIEQNDLDFWLNPEKAKTADEHMKPNFTNAITAVAPYKSADKLKPFHGPTEITAGVKAIPNYGHTVGHTAYSIESKGKKLLLVGDTFHIEAVQFADPSNSMMFDGDQKLSASQRASIFEQASKEGFLLGAAHLPFPGIGHVVKTGKSSYQYLPAPYAPVE